MVLNFWDTTGIDNSDKGGATVNTTPSGEKVQKKRRPGTHDRPAHYSKPTMGGYGEKRKRRGGQQTFSGETKSSGQGGENKQSKPKTAERIQSRGAQLKGGRNSEATRVLALVEPENNSN